MNKEREPELKATWELKTHMARIRLRARVPGRKPQWKFDKAHGLLERDTTGGIDWWRYRHEILQKKLIPFAQKHSLVIQQDKAPSHAAEVNMELLQECGVEVLEWCGNSPDLNMIEPCWPWMKRNAGHYEGFESKKDNPAI